MYSRVKEWSLRYLPPEILSLLFTILAVPITYKITGDRLSVALSATWIGNIGYFGYLLTSDIIVAKKAIHKTGGRYTGTSFFKNIRALFAEFGLAELLDSFLIRPALMFYLPILTGSLTAGSVMAKIIADTTFYIPAIISYELTKSRLRKFD